MLLINKAIAAAGAFTMTSHTVEKEEHKFDVQLDKPPRH
jgi:hypothetical protein